MRFITEDDLRSLYKIKPFTRYELEPGTRLTPGARQFLADKGMNMFEVDSSVNSSPPPEETGPKEQKRLFARLLEIEAIFFLAAEKLLEVDPCLSQKVIILSRQFKMMKSIAEGSSSIDDLMDRECTGIKVNNFGEDLGECFEIEEFHLQFEKSKGILTLHRLRCALQVLAAELPEIWIGSCEDPLCKEISERLYRMANTMSQLICFSLGGKECQRKK